MAARKRKVVLSDDWKEGIRVASIMNRLTSHINGEIELSSTQINAAKIVLAKLVPDLARSEVTGEGGGPVQIVASSLDEKI